MVKRFRTFLQEELSSVQKAGFAKYALDRGTDIHDRTKAINISKHVIPEGTDSIKIPLISELSNSIHEHLTNNGYTHVDYGNGTAGKEFTDINGNKKIQSTSIAKALTKSKAPQHLIDRYANDNKEESAHHNKYDVIISRNPYHIASCSTNPDNPDMWSSCARLTDKGIPKQSGLAADHLPDDIRQGTHVAYLVPKNDTLSHTQLIDQAKARILLKPFESDTGHVVLSPETKSYSSFSKVPSSFHDTVKHFTDTHFPLKDASYHKDYDLYDDDDKNKIYNINILHKIPNELSQDEVFNAIKSKQLHPDDISKYLEIGHTINFPQTHNIILQALTSNKSFNAHHIDKYLNNELATKTTIEKIITNSHFNKNHFDKILESDPSNTNYYSFVNSALGKSNFAPSNKQVDKIINNIDNNTGYPYSEKNFQQTTTINHLQYSNSLTTNHLNTLISKNNGNINWALAAQKWQNNSHKNIIANHLVKHNDYDAVNQFSMYNDLSSEHIDHILNNISTKESGDHSNLFYNISAHNLSSDNIHKIIDYSIKNPGTRLPPKITEQKEFNKDHLIKMLKNHLPINTIAIDQALSAKSFVAPHFNEILPHLSTLHLKTFLNANNSSLQRYYLTGEHLTNILNRPDISTDKTVHEHILKAVIAHPAFNDSHIEQITHNTNEHDYLIAKKPKLSSNTINTLFNKQDPNVITALGSMGHLSKEQQEHSVKILPEFMISQFKNLHSDVISNILSSLPKNSKNNHFTQNLLLNNNYNNITAEHLHHIITQPINNDSFFQQPLLEKIAQHPNLHTNSIQHMINNYHNYDNTNSTKNLFNTLSGHKNATQHQKQTIYNLINN